MKSSACRASSGVKSGEKGKICLQGCTRKKWKPNLSCDQVVAPIHCPESAAAPPAARPVAASCCCLAILRLQLAPKKHQM